MPKDIPSSVDGFGLLGCIRPLALAVEVLQQSIEASGSGARVQVDAADLLQNELYIGRLVWTCYKLRRYQYQSAIGATACPQARSVGVALMSSPWLCE
jgi:hypothetical protein